MKHFTGCFFNILIRYLFIFKSKKCRNPTVCFSFPVLIDLNNLSAIAKCDICE